MGDIMKKVRINFSLDVEGECFAQHSVEYTSVYAMRHPIETDEQKLASEIINKMNELATDKKLQLQNWDCLFGDNVLNNGIYVSTCGDNDQA